VYGSGEDPDPRFSMANERTLLAWLRTSLAFVAAGIAAATLADVVGVRPGLLVAVAVSTSAVGAVSAVTAYVRWARVERALRLRRPLPSPVLGPLLVLAVVLVAAAGVLLGLVG
jgi:putative membrane protein